LIQAVKNAVIVMIVEHTLRLLSILLIVAQQNKKKNIYQGFALVPVSPPPF
jgi:hypothetical protein